MELKVRCTKLSADAVLPFYSREGDAALDLTAISKETIDIGGISYEVYGTGISLEIPSGYFGQIVPRSSVYKAGRVLSNSVGVIDSNYRGEIKFIYVVNEKNQEGFKVGDRVGQILILPYPKIHLVEVNSLTESNRGEQGFGSSGK